MVAEIIEIIPPRTSVVNRLSRVIVVTEIVKACSLDRLFHALVVTELIEAYFRLAPLLLNRFKKQSSSGVHHGEGG